MWSCIWRATDFSITLSRYFHLACELSRVNLKKLNIFLVQAGIHLFATSFAKSINFLRFKHTERPRRTVAELKREFETQK